MIFPAPIGVFSCCGQRGPAFICRSISAERTYSGFSPDIDAATVLPGSVSGEGGGNSQSPLWSYIGDDPYDRLETVPGLSDTIYIKFSPFRRWLTMTETWSYAATSYTWPHSSGIPDGTVVFPTKSQTATVAGSRNSAYHQPAWTVSASLNLWRNEPDWAGGLAGNPFLSSGLGGTLYPQFSDGHIYGIMLWSLTTRSMDNSGWPGPGPLTAPYGGTGGFFANLGSYSSAISDELDVTAFGAVVADELARLDIENVDWGKVQFWEWLDCNRANNFPPGDNQPINSYLPNGHEQGFYTGQPFHASEGKAGAVALAEFEGAGVRIQKTQVKFLRRARYTITQYDRMSDNTDINPVEIGSGNAVVGTIITLPAPEVVDVIGQTAGWSAASHPVAKIGTVTILTAH